LGNLIYFLDDKNSFKSTIRAFFAQILKFLYRWISSAIEAMYNLASNDFGLGSYVENLSGKIFVVLIIFMIFKVTISIMTYVVNPDAFTDKSKGIQNVFKRIVISIVLLVSINPIFSALSYIQDAIIEDGVIENLIMGSNNDTVHETSDGEYVYLIQISPYCETWAPNNKVVAFSKGDMISLLTLKPFIQPSTSTTGADSRKDELLDLEYCGVDVSKDIDYIDSTEMGFYQSISGPKSTDDFLRWEIYNGYTGTWSIENNVYYLDFDYLWALVFGIVVLLIVISFCFDVVKRALTLLVLQVMAPIPIISYISPDSKSSNMLNSWFKKLGSTWASLFIKMLSLSLAISFIGAISDSAIIKDGSGGLIIQLIAIAGTLMFAKELPKLLEELIPGLKMGNGFELNPFKKISKEALGGNMLLGAGAGILGAGLAGGTNAIHRLGSGISQGVNNARNVSGFRNKAGAILNSSLRGAARGVGSGLTGAARAGINAFGRTSKDGRIFNGAWNGYQTSMYSKLLREDNLRKAGLENASLGDKMKFAAGSVLADGARYVGVLNKGQSEYLDAARMDNQIKSMESKLSEDKLNLTIEKQNALAPFQEYAKYAQKIKEKIDNESNVKTAQQLLEDAQATGNASDIAAARNILEEAKKTAGQKLLSTDRETRAYASKLQEIRNNNSILKDNNYDFIDDKGFFKASSIYNANSQANITEMSYASREKEFEIRQQQIDSIKNSKEYMEAHDENSRAKLQNSSRINRDVQQPGYKPSAGPAQETAFDRYVGGHPGGHNSDHGPGRQFLPPDNGGNPRP